MGDFNIPSFGNEDELQVHHPLIHVTTERNLIQLSCVATRHDSFLDLVFVSSHFMNSVITNVAPISGSDHEGQLCKIHHSFNRSRHTTWKTHTDYTLLNQFLLQVNWDVFFSGRNNTDKYAERFYGFFLDAISKSSTRKKISRRQRLPRHIVKLLRLKKKAWRKAKKTNNYDRV